MRVDQKNQKNNVLRKGIVFQVINSENFQQIFYKLFAYA